MSPIFSNQNNPNIQYRQFKAPSGGTPNLNQRPSKGTEQSLFNRNAGVAQQPQLHPARIDNTATPRNYENPLIARNSTTVFEQVPNKQPQAVSSKKTGVLMGIHRVARHVAHGHKEPGFVEQVTSQFNAAQIGDGLSAAKTSETLAHTNWGKKLEGYKYFKIFDKMNKRLATYVDSGKSYISNNLFKGKAMPSLEASTKSVVGRFNNWLQGNSFGRAIGSAQNIAKWGGRAAFVITVAKETIDIVKAFTGTITAKDRAEGITTRAEKGSVQIGTSAGAIIGGWAGAEIGATIGSFVFPPVGTFVGAIAGGCIGAFAGSSAGKALGKAIVKSGKVIAGAVATGAKVVWKGVKTAGKAIANGAKKVWNAGKKVVGKIVDMHKKVFKTVANGVKKVAGAVKNVAKKAVNTVKNIVKKPIQAAKNVARKAVNTVKNVAKKLNPFNWF